jgi:hypothetical protein
MKNKIMFILILLGAFFVRNYGINWDQGFHLHPDERMLIMVADKINLFKNLNPDFFNYGSLPIYLLKGISQLIDFLFNEHLANYNGMLIIGRSLSVFFDLITVYLIFKIAKKLFNEKKIALFASFFYTFAFFPIQNSHFFVVDVLLNTLTTALIFTLITYHISPSLKKVFSLSLIFAAMMATKFTAIIFLPIIFLIIILKTMKQRNNGTISLITFIFTFFIFHFFFMPYAYIEHVRFISDIKAQLTMNSNPYIFPYTLQYVGTIPYIYYLKNIFLWGLGPFISILSLIGIYNIGKFLIFNYKFLIKSKFFNFINKNSFQISNLKFQIIFFAFYFIYFLVIGRSAVKFMRYMLPLYPFFCILAGYGLYKLYKLDKLYKLLSFAFLILTLIYSFMFLNIYSVPHTRIAATEWILKNIPEGSHLAVEHWDDRVPIYDGEKYIYEEMTLYEQPDDEVKWKVLNEKLSKTDYIVIASNRLYIPLQRLNNCKIYKSCYPLTAKYYEKLFGEKLGFKKVAEFSAYPTFQILNFKFQILDDNADESFTVYDHPKIMILKKIH